MKPGMEKKNEPAGLARLAVRADARKGHRAGLGEQGVQHVLVAPARGRQHMSQKTSGARASVTYEKGRLRLHRGGAR